MTWSQSYAEDPPATHRHQQGVKTTTTGHPRAMYSSAMHAWDPIGGELVVGVRQMDYGPGTCLLRATAEACHCLRR